MNTLFIECNMGAAGDMLMAALSQLIPDRKQFEEEINQIGLKGVKISGFPVEKCGISGLGMSVRIQGREEEEVLGHTHTHDHDGLEDILHMINSLAVSDQVKADAIAVYRLLAGAECFVHQKELKDLHFHEVGTLDAVADIVGVCMLMEEIGPEKIIVSPIHTGSGFIDCAHGTLPVPAPATAKLLEGIPIYSTGLKGELCTPTGAALLKYFGDEFGPMPPMSVSKIGYGMGKKDFEAANCVRVFMGEPFPEITDGANEKVAVLTCNLDDMTGEAMGFASELLFEEGALDVFSTSIQMKKNRPGQTLSCICRPEDAQRMAKLMLKHTTSFGVKKELADRYKLEISFSDYETEYGKIRIKEGTGYGLQKSKPEYEDLRKLAKIQGLSLDEVKKALFK